MNHIAFRTDSSVEIGLGHVMRCLTLAGALRQEGARCSFLCRDVPGHSAALVRDRGFPVEMLRDDTAEDARAALGRLTRETGAAVTGLMVDHYGLDADWEHGFYDDLSFVGVLDDLNNRPHCCHLLLDQTLGKDGDAYRGLVPQACALYMGSRYALLRPEFATLRQASLSRRAALEDVRHILVTLGGMDRDNVTLLALKALEKILLPEGCEITVVAGVTAPHRGLLKAYLTDSPLAARLRIGVDNMAQVMVAADFCIGAAGSTAWERCCLGLPTLQLVLADNQERAARELENAGAALHGGAAAGLTPFALAERLGPLLRDGKRLRDMSARAAGVCDGTGAAVMARHILAALP